VAIAISLAISSAFRAGPLAAAAAAAAATAVAKSRDDPTTAERIGWLPLLVRSPSEVKVGRVGTGCARIHFFGLAPDFFSLPGSHVCA
jgi:hypothetical protein